MYVYKLMAPSCNSKWFSVITHWFISKGPATRTNGSQGSMYQIRGRVPSWHHVHCSPEETSHQAVLCRQKRTVRQERQHTGRNNSGRWNHTPNWVWFLFVQSSRHSGEHREDNRCSLLCEVRIQDWLDKQIRYNGIRLRLLLHQNANNISTIFLYTFI